MEAKEPHDAPCARSCAISAGDTGQEISQKVGYPRAGHPKKPVDVEKVRAMRASGFSMPQIGAYFDVSEATILHRLHG